MAALSAVSWLQLTGGWDRGHGDRGTIGMRILTGRLCWWA
jgi:hypothetical protein